MNETLVYLIAFIILVILHALSDGFLHAGSKFKAPRYDKFLFHIFSALHILVWLILLWLKLDFKLIYVYMYILIRFALFDITWNLVNGLPPLFTGTTSFYGKFWKLLENKTRWESIHILFWLKLISLLIAISFITY